MRLFSSLFVLMLTSFVYGQATGKFIEVVVKEDVELKVLSAKMSLSVHSEEEQMAEIFESEYSDEYEEYMEEEYYSVEEMTKAERKRYEEERQKREDLYREQEELLAQKVENFVPYTIQELMTTLRANNITFEIQERGMTEDNEEWMEMNEMGPASDSLLVVTLLDEAAQERLQDLISDKAVDSEITDITYENADAHLLTLAPKMAERAKKQAEALALSVGKKVGPVLQISNAYPGFSPALLDIQLKEIRQISLGARYFGNAFQSTRSSYIEVIYRFAMID